MTQFDKFVEDVMTGKCEGLSFDAKMDDVGKLNLEVPEAPETAEGAEAEENAEPEELTPCEQLEKVLALFDITDEERAEILEKLKDKAMEMAEHEAGETPAEEAKEQETVEAEEETKEEDKK